MSSYTVEFTKSKKVVRVKEGESVLKVAVESGVDLDYLCTDGNCGTCKVKLLRGEIDYKREPDILWEGEREEGIVLLCQAMPKSDLEVEA